MSWIAAELDPTDYINDYSYFGLCVAPGFEFDEFEMADAAELIQKYPEHAKIIRRMI